MNMKSCLLFAAALLLVAGPAAGAERSVTLEARTRIVDGSREWHEERRYPYRFQVEVISDSSGRKGEERRDGFPFITAEPGERYRVRIHNPLPVRVAANLSIDGLNSLTGRPGTPEGGKKWVIEPESWVDISGWQVSGRAARRFYFTSKGESYAQWRSDDWGRDLSVNCGVIGVAYFWSQRELDGYFDRHPVVIRRRDERRRDDDGRGDRPMQAPRSSTTGDRGAPLEEQRAGTGMGERESNPVHEVRFSYDRGMYRAKDAVIITYDFAEERRHRPRPFEEPGYAPEPRESYLFDNGNTARVYSRPRRPTWITVEVPTRIVKITNYHWNNGRGASPGTIGLERHDGITYGPWRAGGSAGQGGRRNVYWTVYPDVTIPPGTYRVIDSSPGTWSYNRGSGESGMTRVEGVERE